MYTADERIYFFVERIANTDLNSVSTELLGQMFLDAVADAKAEIEYYNDPERLQAEALRKLRVARVW